MQIRPIIGTLVASLSNQKNKPQDKIQEFYAVLNSTSTTVKNDKDQPLKNIDIIKKDTSKFARNFLTGLAIIAATLLTGIVPGLIIATIVYAATGRHPLDLLKGEGERFGKELNLVKEQNKLKSYVPFFQPAPAPKEIIPDEPAPDSGNKIE